MIQIVSQFSFEAAHRLFLYDGKCVNIHGHTYKVEVSLSTDVKYVKTDYDFPGIAIDFSSVKNKVGKYLDLNYDHYLFLNVDDDFVKVAYMFTQLIKIFPTNPTAEVMAVQILKDLREIFKEESIIVQYVRLWETEKNSVIATKESIDAISLI